MGVLVDVYGRRGRCANNSRRLLVSLYHVCPQCWLVQGPWRGGEEGEEVGWDGMGRRCVSISFATWQLIGTGMIRPVKGLTSASSPACSSCDRNERGGQTSVCAPRTRGLLLAQGSTLSWPCWRSWRSVWLCSRVYEEQCSGASRGPLLMCMSVTLTFHRICKWGQHCVTWRVHPCTGRM